jgi:arsenite/tail-anchored protein-transporting ATPase
MIWEIKIIVMAKRDAAKMNNYEQFKLENINLTKYLFFTGKGGVGKTSTACAVAVGLADIGKRILLVSTDPASNLQDVFNTDLSGTGVEIEGVTGLVVANLDPEEAAREYREGIIKPYRGLLPDSAIANMEEQLSGSCTVEIAAFDQFSNYITNDEIESIYDHIIFDTAPTGHTLRMLQLPSAWTDFIADSTHGASCLGPLAGLEKKKGMYKDAVDSLADGKKTTLILVSRPEPTPLIEAERSSLELKELGIKNQVLVINGCLLEATDDISQQIYNKQQQAIREMPVGLSDFDIYLIPLRSYNILGLENIRAFFKSDGIMVDNLIEDKIFKHDLKDINILVEDLYHSKKKVIFTMGKGGVGKTTIAATIAIALAQKGLQVHLTTTDPANHLQYIAEENRNITLSNIDEEKELAKYREEVLSKAGESLCQSDLEYIEEDLKSPCTQEIAVFRAFAEIVNKAENEVVVIDTAPTGHTLLLLDSTLSYHKEVLRTKGEIPLSVQGLLPRLRDEKETEVVIVTLPEATPFYEALRLQADLKRAGINNKWWVVNQCLSLVKTSSPLLMARKDSEKRWLDEIDNISSGNFIGIPWLSNVTVDNIIKLK